MTVGYVAVALYCMPMEKCEFKVRINESVVHFWMIFFSGLRIGGDSGGFL